MRYRLPPLNALRAFEAAARHRNIARAAEELSVSAGAVSRHVAILERHLGRRLFDRQHRGVTPTDAGLRYLKEVGDAFGLIDSATRQLGGVGPSSTLRIRLFTTLMSDWLSPRIGGFRSAYPDIGLRLMGSLQRPDFAAEDLDLGTLLGPGEWPDLHHEELFHATFTPVCAPALLAGDRPLRRPEDIRDHALLHSPLLIPFWNEWLSRAGVGSIDTSVGLQFDSSSHSYHAARQGAGVALGQTFFLLDDLRSGRLVAPFGLSVRSPLAYCLVCQRARKDEPAISAFRQWIVEEARKTAQDAARILGAER